MSDDVLKTLINAIFPAITTVALAFLALYFKRLTDIAKSNATKLEETNVAVTTLERNTNSMKDALVKLTGEAENAKGNLQGVADERARAAAAVPPLKDTASPTPVVVVNNAALPVPVTTVKTERKET